MIFGGWDSVKVVANGTYKYKAESTSMKTAIDYTQGNAQSPEKC
jgi:hypothetical protein